MVIVADRSSRVSVNGSLLLTSADGAMQGLLPPLSRDVDHVTITWAANSSEVGTVWLVYMYVYDTKLLYTTL